MLQLVNTRQDGDADESLHPSDVPALVATGHNGDRTTSSFNLPKVLRTFGMGNRRDQTVFDALSRVIAYELNAQLALADIQLASDDIDGIAEMIADALLDAFAITPLGPAPTA